MQNELMQNENQVRFCLVIFINYNEKYSVLRTESFVFQINILILNILLRPQFSKVMLSNNKNNQDQNSYVHRDEIDDTLGDFLVSSGMKYFNQNSIYSDSIYFLIVQSNDDFLVKNLMNCPLHIELRNGPEA